MGDDDFEIPAFLKISPKKREQAWRRNPPRPLAPTVEPKREVKFEIVETIKKQREAHFLNRNARLKERRQYVKGARWAKVNGRYQWVHPALEHKANNPFKGEQKVNIKELSGPQLAEEYNKLAKLAGKPTIKRFATIEAGKKRLAELQKEKEKKPKKEKPKADGIAGEFNARPGTNRERLIAALGKHLNKQVEEASLIKATYGKESADARGALMMVLKGVEAMIKKYSLPYKVIKDEKTIGLHAK